MSSLSSFSSLPSWATSLGFCNATLSTTTIPRAGFSSPCEREYGFGGLKKAQSQCSTQRGTMLAFQACMRVTGPFELDSRSALKIRAPNLRVCEKSSASSALDQQPQNSDSRERTTSTAMRVEIVSQEETPRFDPFWDGPKLLPSFVTQVMGQLLPERRDVQVSVETAYGSARNPRMALVLDRKS